jgi:hypothetical protein
VSSPPSAARQGIAKQCPERGRSCFFEQPQLQRLLGHDLFQIAGLTAQILNLARRRRTGPVARQALLPSLKELLGPAVVEALGNAISAMLSSPFRPSSTILIFSSTEYCLRVARRMSLTTFSPWLLRVQGFCLISTPWCLRCARNPLLSNHTKMSHWR